jgi:hypothetical protein
VYFENTRCLHCEQALGYCPEAAVLTGLERSAGQGQRTVYSARAPGLAGQLFRYCENANRGGGCNWLVPAAADQPYCRSCRLTLVIPDLAQGAGRAAWIRIERDKRRLIYTLDALGLPLESPSGSADGPPHRLSFRLLQDEPGQPAITGHADGVITLNVAEADSAFREHTREKLGEAYRTVLGHLRHESGHYYWDRLIRDDSTRTDAFRELFGDERADYQHAIDQHYDRGPPPAWMADHVSSYASMHPWEDWAETWAHYLHLLDTVETAYWYGVGIAPKAGRDTSLTTIADVDPYGVADFSDLQRIWFPVIYLGNSLNRSMGQPDLYPFVLTPLVLDKLRFVHQVARGVRNYTVDAVPPGAAEGVPPQTM